MCKISDLELFLEYGSVVKIPFCVVRPFRLNVKKVVERIRQCEGK